MSILVQLIQCLQYEQHELVQVFELCMLDMVFV
jgi:hypothetical protein